MTTSLPPVLHTGLSTSGQVELSVFLLVGLLGGAHCLGMCGPLVTVYADRLRDGGSQRSDGRRGGVTFRELRQHLLFNLGRTGSYAALGGLFGLAGALFYDAAETVLVVGGWVRATLGLTMGLLVVGTGLRYLGGDYGGHAAGGRLPLVGRLASLFGRLQARIDGWVHGPGIVALGLVHGLLPCPLLYPAYLYAFVRGSPTTGVLTLGVLGLGTVPALFAYGTVLGTVGATGRERLHRALGVAFLVLGLMPIAHALALFGLQVPHLEPPIYQPLGG
ncbi:sulfite exporter TauE/SafE family protein [Salinirubellus salinus]|uniref:Sulfite exporter TauE/SafE family protein n=1 Tax=Salinirubellus salinus TaxID=1364945 RepID=A0A9E7U6X1_9EURY|nr:sulfite exporter TauE/SafE family protein [Salinirubellus salinus]UWM56880.1 sulfite exporter TauE/SafE family protein [Salinirubellus salinus]